MLGRVSAQISGREAFRQDVVLRAKDIIQDTIQAEAADTIVRIESHRFRIANDLCATAFDLKQSLSDRRIENQVLATLRAIAMYRLCKHLGRRQTVKNGLERGNLVNQKRIFRRAVSLMDY